PPSEARTASKTATLRHRSGFRIRTRGSGADAGLILRVDSGDTPIARGAQARQAGTMNLNRPRSNRVIAGVCAAVANRFGWKPNTVRVHAVLSCLLPGPQFVIYLVLWVLIPSEGTSLAGIERQS